MMRKVVIHAHAFDFAPQLHASGDSRERLQRVDGMLYRHTGVARSSDRGNRILHVVSADERPMHGAA